MKLLLLGECEAAMRAARRLGHEFLVLEPSPPGAGAPGGTTLGGPPIGPAFDRQVRDLCRGESIDGVLSTSDSHSLVAARARSVLGIPDHQRYDPIALQDKSVLKQRLRSAGVPCTQELTLMPGIEPRAVLGALGTPCVVKPRMSPGYRGAATIHGPEDLVPFLHRGWVAERWVEGTGHSLEALLLDGEVVLLSGTEWILSDHAFVQPSLLGEGLYRRLRSLVKTAAEAIDLTSGMIRIEFFQTTAAEVIVGDVAVGPAGPLIMDGLRASWGIDPWECVINLQLGIEVELPERNECTSVTMTVHPGGGLVRSVDGVAEARAMPGVEEVQLAFEPGTILCGRSGRELSAGWIRACGPGSKEALERVRAAHACLRIGLVDLPSERSEKDAARSSGGPR